MKKDVPGIILTLLNGLKTLKILRAPKILVLFDVDISRRL